MKNIFRVLIWIVFFPFMILIWGIKSKNKVGIIAGGVLSLIFTISVILYINDSNKTGSASIIEETTTNVTRAKGREDEVNSSNAEILVNDSKNDNGSTDQLNKENITDTIEPDSETSENQEIVESKPNTTDSNKSEGMFEGYTNIEVYGGDQSGEREANSVVDIGYADREYWAFTNEYGQLVRVIADEIILQDESTEDVNSDGRYYDDEAKVPGTEAADLDEGHVIADSLGGVANAYNITPQDSTLNRYGDQAYMEKTIRDAGGCKNFEAIINYPDTITQIPSSYTYTYEINGMKIVDEFLNINPDESKVDIVVEENTGNDIEEVQTSNKANVKITSLDKKKEYIIISNVGDSDVDVTGWRILSVLGEQEFIIPTYIIKPGATLKIGDSEENGDVDFHWLDGRGTWNNSKSDSAELYDSDNYMIDRWND